MDYVINTQQGIVFNFSTETVNLDEFIKQLNNQQLTAVSLSDIGLHKRNILHIAPKVPTAEGTYQLNTIDQSSFLVTPAEGDTVADIVDRVNDRTQQFIRIGEVIIQSQHFDFIIGTAALPTMQA